MSYAWVYINRHKLMLYRAIIVATSDHCSPIRPLLCIFMMAETETLFSAIVNMHYIDVIGTD